MRAQFETARQDTVRALMREAGWDPQSHDREGVVGVRGHVTQIIDILDAGGGARALRAFPEASRRIATYLNDQGYYRSCWKKEPLTSDKVEAVLRENLGQHFTLPTALKLVEP